MPAGAKYCILFGAFHVSSHAALKCKLIVKEQNFNRIYVKIQWAFVGCACGDLPFTCQEGKFSGRMNRRSGLTDRKNWRKQNWVKCQARDLKAIFCLWFKHRELYHANWGEWATFLCWRVSCFVARLIHVTALPDYTYIAQVVCVRSSAAVQPDTMAFWDLFSSLWALEHSRISHNSKSTQVSSATPNIWAWDLGFFTIEAHMSELTAPAG